MEPSPLDLTPSPSPSRRARRRSHHSRLPLLPRLPHREAAVGRSTRGSLRRGAAVMLAGLACAGSGVALVAVAPPASAAPKTFFVSKTTDGGPGSLRQAITDANANPGADTIK